ncbi:putative methyltransferase DDB_G0268948 [Solea solea]|uniref:putative methyltransferase DDB_G0268948 n=1 Tax=Solea solea TaxID=90069 RepID=UPI00272AA40A|nr:putative methyltransferase DDB_G0268948 [Solea solea]
MTHRFFEGKEHASIYQTYRFPPPDGLRNIILQYLDNKKGQPHELAVDLGCGTGQNCQLFAPHFKEVVGMDVSECQLDEARAVQSCPNITYRKGTAEELPFSHNSVDLLTAASAAHWFDQDRFLAEASRVLKPRGCMALLGYSDMSSKLHYKNCGEQLTHIFKEMKQTLMPHTNNRVAVCENKLEDLYAAITFPDKERVEYIEANQLISLRNLIGFIETWSAFQTYKKKDPKSARDLLLNTQDRFLAAMAVTSLDTELKWELEYYCVLAS